MTGPPPKKEKRRRNPTPGFKLLPHEGRQGPPPEWPLGIPTPGELQVWNDLWKLPQAVEWERMAYLRTVARYVRTVVEAELPGADTKLLSEARQLEDRLGVTPRAMLSLRWETDEPIEVEEETPDPPKDETTRRISAVAPEAT